jgi:hypothetical protein
MSAADDESVEYEHFLEDLQSVVAERVDALRTRQSASPPKAFLDDNKVVRDWPELAGRIIEEFR